MLLMTAHERRNIGRQQALACSGIQRSMQLEERMPITVAVLTFPDEGGRGLAGGACKGLCACRLLNGHRGELIRERSQRQQ